jgi:hypothetical protein
MPVGFRHTTSLGALVIAGLVLIAGCQDTADGVDLPDVIDEVDNGENATEDPVVDQPVEKEFFLPATCLDIATAEAVEKLTTDPNQLLRGPGADTDEPVYAEPTPQENLGGITCFFGDSEETRTYTVSIAPVTPDNRAQVIEGLLEQKLNVDQTPAGALIYAIDGDDTSTPATYNTLWPDAWYEVLVSPGGRISAEEAARIARAMRDHTYR